MSQVSCLGPELALVLAEGALTTGTQGSHGCPPLPRLSEDLLPAEGGTATCRPVAFPASPGAGPQAGPALREAHVGLAMEPATLLAASRPTTARRRLSCVPNMGGTCRRDTACSPGLSSAASSRLATQGRLVGSGNHGAKDRPWRVRPPQDEPDVEV